MKNRKRGKRPQPGRLGTAYRAVVSWAQAQRSMPAHEGVGEDLVKALGFFVFVVAVHLYLDAHPYGKLLKDFQFGLLRQSLTQGALDEPGSQAGSIDLPVVFDVSRLHPDKTLPTCREKLDRIIQELTKPEIGVKAIGVDLEFAENTDKNTLDRPEDFEYLARWRDIRTEGKRCKVRVGVYHRALKRSEYWLGRPEFVEMAAGIALPKEDPNHAFLYSRTCFDKISGLPVKCEAGRKAEIETDKALVQMPAAMWEILKDREALPALEKKLSRSYDSGFLEVGEYFIDYSYLKQIKSEIIAPTSIDVVPGLLSSLKNRLRNRIVLIGDLEDFGDQFCYAPRQRPMAGALIHACSIATLTRGQFKEIEGRSSLGIELLFFAVALLCPIVVVRLLYKYSPKEIKLNYQQIEILVFGTVAIAIFLMFQWWIRAVGKVWADFFWVSAALFLHPFLTTPFYRTCVALPKMLQAFALAFAHRDSGGNHDR